MSAFYDTNVLIYAQEDGEKGANARALLGNGGKVSVQVLNEFASVSYRKFGKTWDEICIAVDDILAVVDAPLALTIDLHTSARLLASTHKLSFYDALVVAAALEADCQTLYSEDMQHGRKFDGLRVINPFTSG